MEGDALEMINKQKVIGGLVAIHEYCKVLAEENPDKADMIEDWKEITANAVCLLNKDYSSKPIKGRGFYKCTDCGEFLIINQRFCDRCGKAQDWK